MGQCLTLSFFLSLSGKCFSASAEYSFELSSSFSRLQMYRFIMANANIHRIFVQKDAILQTFSTRIAIFRRTNRKFFFISRGERWYKRGTTTALVGTCVLAVPLAKIQADLSVDDYYTTIFCVFLAEGTARTHVPTKAGVVPKNCMHFRRKSYRSLAKINTIFETDGFQ